MIELAVGYQRQIAIIWALSLLLLRAILVVYPDVNIDAPLYILSILELDLEARVAEPFDVHLSLQWLVRQWLLV